jgi:hypothetical protein
MQARLLRCKLLVVALLLAVSLLHVSGCKSGLQTAALMFWGTDEDAEYPGLKGKRVAVICRPLAGLEIRNASASRELAKKVSEIIKKKVSKVEVVDAQKIEKWIDEKGESDVEPAKVGRAMKAERVVVIDITAPIELYDGQTLYRGKTVIALSIYDMETKKTEFEDTLTCEYPPSTGVPTSYKTESQFRSEFLAHIAQRVCRYFYKHDPNEDVGLDATAGLH